MKDWNSTSLVGAIVHTIRSIYSRDSLAAEGISTASARDLIWNCGYHCRYATSTQGERWNLRWRNSRFANSVKVQGLRMAR